MQKQYINKDSDHLVAYKNLCALVEDTHRSGVEFLNTMTRHSKDFERSVESRSFKSAEPDAIKSAIQSALRLYQVLDVTQKRFEAKVNTAIRKYDKIYVVRIKTADGYLRSDISEARVKAARRLQIRKMQKDAVKSMNTNSPKVFATKNRISDKLSFNVAKILGDDSKKLELASKIYNDMIFAMANYKKYLDDKLDKTRSMIISVDGRHYTKQRDDMTNLINVAKLIDLCFEKIADTLGHAKGTLDLNAHSLVDTFERTHQDSDEWRNYRLD